MNEPIYVKPATLAQALATLAEWGNRARPLAGGTDLLVALRRGLHVPEALVDISGLGELGGIRRDGAGRVVIGALVTHGEIRNSQELACQVPLLAQACRDVGSPQIRNRGTLGGNLGNASPAGDTIPTLYVLEAEVNLLSTAGERWIPVTQFFTGPGRTVCRPGEIIAAVRFAPLAPGERSFWLKLGQRRALRVSKASAAGTLLIEDGRVCRCRLALGALAPTVIRLPEAEQALVGRIPTAEMFEAAAELAGQLCSPIDDIRSTVAYRRTSARTLVRRGLQMMYEDGKS